MRRFVPAAAVLAPLVLAAYAPVSTVPHDSASVHGTRADSTTAVSVAFAEAALGRSGALRTLVAAPGEPLLLPLEWTGTEPEGVRYRWTDLDGGPAAGVLLGEARLEDGVHAPTAPGNWRLSFSTEGWAQELPEIVVITRVPASETRSGVLNGYRIGHYPAAGRPSTDPYAPPAGFIEVTLENRDLHVSEHFRLRDFLTKDQHDVWPKYLALDLQLIDKLELVLQELNAMGVRAEGMTVMSGYRTPHYNGPGGNGRAKLSRHTYGDAADVWVDNEGDGWMSDLNGDGTVDVQDARVILRAVDRVEARHPEVAGGAGLYYANSVRGPFIHIDVRGAKARW